MNHQERSNRGKISFLPIFLFLSLACILSVLSSAEAAITFTDGYWSTSFAGCNTGNATAGYSCDGLSIPDNYTCNGTYSQVTSSANNDSGKGGNGYRIYMLGNARNTMSTPMQVTFPTPQKAFWLRFYYRIPNGQSLGSIREHKLIYAFTNGPIAADINWPSGDYIMLQPRGTMGSSDISYTGFGSGHRTHGGPEGGWGTVYGSNSAAADGTWHVFEVHFDLGTSGSNNGVFQMWIDGVNYVNDTDLDWFNGGAASPTGWSYVNVPSNHNVWALAGCIGHDIDDMAVATPSYAGFIRDADGRQMIGKTLNPPKNFRKQN